MTSPEIAEVSPGIWRVRRRQRASYVVKTSPGAVLINTGSVSSGADVMMALQRARVGLSSLRAILLTSADVEAGSGAAALEARSGATIYGPAPLPAALPGAVEVEPLRGGEVVAKYFEALGSDQTPATLAFYFRPARVLFAARWMTLSTHDVALQLLTDGTKSGA